MKALAWEDADGKVWLTCNDARMDRAAPRSGSGKRAGGAGHRGRSCRRRQSGDRRLTARDTAPTPHDQLEARVPDTVRDNPALNRFELDLDGRMAVGLL